ncbi:MAG: hypothetical protein Q8J97_02700, partial [Flavobacteriaceae bacterium]|nr:hypothetical protein [Flavobacteriaceae bacterium]
DVIVRAKSRGVAWIAAFVHQSTINRRVPNALPASRYSRHAFRLMTQRCTRLARSRRTARIAPQQSSTRPPRIAYVVARASPTGRDCRVRRVPSSTTKWHATLARRRTETTTRHARTMTHAGSQTAATERQP